MCATHCIEIRNCNKKLYLMHCLIFYQSVSCQYYKLNIYRTHCTVKTCGTNILFTVCFIKDSLFTRHTVSVQYIILWPSYIWKLNKFSFSLVHLLLWKGQSNKMLINSVLRRDCCLCCCCCCCLDLINWPQLYLKFGFWYAARNLMPLDNSTLL